MPVSVAEWLWWAFNGTVLIGIWMIKRELTRSNNLQERNQRNNHRIFMFMIQINARCNLFHADRPALTPPEYEE